MKDPPVTPSVSEAKNLANKKPESKKSVSKLPVSVSSKKETNTGPVVTVTGGGGYIRRRSGTLRDSGFGGSSSSIPNNFSSDVTRPAVLMLWEAKN